MAYREKDTKKWTAQWFETNVMGEKKKRRKRGFETKREALEFERSKKLSSERSMDMKLSDFIEIYFSDKQNDLKDRTIKNKRYMMQQHIVPYFGNQMMSEIKASQIIQWQNEIQKKGYSDSYLRMIQNQLTSLFTHAAKIYDLLVNPCKKVKRMGNSDSRSLNFWTLDEYKQFIQTMEPGTRYYLMFEMLFWTGCRIGELLAITKADINFEKNQLSINKTYYRTGMQDIITEPKTKQSFRTIEIPEFLKEEIKEFVDGHYGMPDTERLFPVVQEAVQHKMKRQYNVLDEYDPRREEILRGMLGKVGQVFYFQGPVQFNYGSHTFIGENFFANFNLTVMDDGKIIIGDHVCFGPNVSLMATSHPLISQERMGLNQEGKTTMAEYAPEIVIGNQVWIACNTVVLGGVHIGDGAVIGAGSVVTKDIPAHYLAFGNPCRPIRPITEADSKRSLILPEDQEHFFYNFKQ